MIWEIKNRTKHTNFTSKMLVTVGAQKNGSYY